MRATSPKTLDDVEPTRLYAVADFARLCPSPRGGHLSFQAANLICEQGRIPARRMPATANGISYFAILGADIIAYLTGKPVEQPACPNIDKRVNAARRRIDLISGKKKRNNRRTASAGTVGGGSR